jgi:hypothetical protein
MPIPVLSADLVARSFKFVAVGVGLAFGALGAGAGLIASRAASVHNSPIAFSPSARAGSVSACAA